MHSVQCRGRHASCILPAPHRRFSVGVSLQHLWFLALIAFQVHVVHAQGADGIDCTDPRLASTTECSNQGQTGSQSQILRGTPGGAFSTTPSASGNQAVSGSLTSAYSDVEQLSRRDASQQQAAGPLEPLTEFQRFVASTTSVILPVYGANLFRGAPSTFAPVDLAPVPSNYVVGPGDELRIRVWGQISIASNLRVDRSGDIYMPQVGEVHVAGLA